MFVISAWCVGNPDREVWRRFQAHLRPQRPRRRAAVPQIRPYCILQIKNMNNVLRWSYVWSQPGVNQSSADMITHSLHTAHTFCVHCSQYVVVIMTRKHALLEVGLQATRQKKAEKVCEILLQRADETTLYLHTHTHTHTHIQSMLLCCVVMNQNLSKSTYYNQIRSALSHWNSCSLSISSTKACVHSQSSESLRSRLTHFYLKYCQNLIWEEQHKHGDNYLGNI